jgi:hypothetical protein
MISNFFTKTFTVNRPTWTEDEEYNQFSALSSAGTFKGYLQQANAQLAQNFGLKFSKTFTIWCAINEDVVEGDELVYTADPSDVYTYVVRAIQKNNDGVNKHLELVVELDEDKSVLDEG